jgi:hypothetical protein
MGLSAQHTASRNDNDDCTIGQTVATIPYTHNQNQWIISIIFLHSSYADKTLKKL